MRDRETPAFDTRRAIEVFTFAARADEDPVVWQFVPDYHAYPDCPRFAGKRRQGYI